MERGENEANGNCFAAGEPNGAKVMTIGTDVDAGEKETEHGPSEKERPSEEDVTVAGAKTEAVAAEKSKETASPNEAETEAIAKGGERLTTRLHVGHLTRNVTEEHLRSIFSLWGPLKNVEIAMDRAVQLSKGFAHVEFEKHDDAVNALDHMHGGQIDGNMVEVKFVQAMRKKEPSPIPVPVRRAEAIPTHRSNHRGRPYEAERRRSPLRYRRRSPVRRYSRSPPRRRSPHRHRSRTPPPRRPYNGGYAYGNRGPSPRRRRSPYRARRRSPSPRYRRREPVRSPASKRSRRSSSSVSSSMSKSSSMSSSGSSSPSTSA